MLISSVQVERNANVFYALSTDKLTYAIDYTESIDFSII